MSCSPPVRLNFVLAACFWVICVAVGSKGCCYLRKALAFIPEQKWLSPTPLGTHPWGARKGQGLDAFKRQASR